MNCSSSLSVRAALREASRERLARWVPCVEEGRTQTNARRRHRREGMSTATEGFYVKHIRGTPWKNRWKSREFRRKMDVSEPGDIHASRAWSQREVAHQV